MFRGLRFRLTLLYLLAALALLVLVVGGTYWLLNYYFQTTTDHALQHKMALQFQMLGAPLPPELQSADQAWYTQRHLSPPVPTDVLPPVQSDEGDVSEEEQEAGGGARSDEEIYDSELASIFVTLANPEGQS